ncbi:hypothetical protein [Phocaeicola sp.]|jgi:hypothetical protein|uniref:hypothetical protein n=1 Tax=Phocaeicola sp. TaxID=2773926 RepID=UPI0023D23833|nr:hypothetical protein [Phocaeicola sp.]MDE5677380.1 hypothetical protein [Phocaeicola sp.]
MSINDDMPCFGGVPIDVRVSRGRLRCVPPYSDNELEFTQIEGRLTSVSKVKWHGFPYWCVCLHDGMNEYHLLFFQKSGMFVRLLACLFGRTVGNLSIELGPLPDGSVQMIVEADGKRLEPLGIKLPPVKRHRKKEGVNPKDWQDYTDRLNAVQKLVESMSQPTHTHKGEGC